MRDELVDPNQEQWHAMAHRSHSHSVTCKLTHPQKSFAEECPGAYR